MNRELIPTLEAIDVLCVGHACYDLIFSVPYHPATDDKIVANSFLGCGGGPAANAAITVSRLGLKAAFAGYLGQDLYGDKHYQEFVAEKITTKLIVRGSNPTPLSSILVKPDGNRALINYKGETQALPAKAIDFSSVNPKVILFDGHQPQVSLALLELAGKKSIPTVLDAGSLHEGTEQLMSKVDYLVCSEKFAKQFAKDANSALHRLAKISSHVVITLGEKGLIWQCKNEQGCMPAFPVAAIDTTGAGDAFHGAFSAAVALQMNWLESLRYASAAGALCCTKMGARTGLPFLSDHTKLYQSQ